MYIPTVLPTHPGRLPGPGALLFLAWMAASGPQSLAADSPALPASPDKRASNDQGSGATAQAERSFRAFLPRPGATAEEPGGHVIQLLLDRQEKEGYESYLIQVLFRGAPALEHVRRVYPDRVEVDFLDTGKPSMRLARVRGGVVEATSLEELHYREAGKLKRLVRLTLYTATRPDLRIRNTLDRVLIHFRHERKPGNTPESASQPLPPGISPP